MPNVFEYTDYHSYLADYCAQRKARNPAFSFQALAMKAGFKHRAFLHNVARGRKNLSAESAAKLSGVVTANAREAQYFELLVAFGNARSERTREGVFERLNSLKSGKTGAARIRELRRDQYEFYAVWYHAAVRSLIDMYAFADDYEWLASKVRPAITPRQARLSVELLERLGLISRDTRGRYRVADKTIRAGDAIERMAMRRFHREVGELALKALDAFPVEQRNVTGLTLGISEEAYEGICRETAAFQQRLLAIAERDAKADRVYQYNFQIFPLCDTHKKGPSR